MGVVRRADRITAGARAQGGIGLNFDDPTSRHQDRPTIDDSPPVPPTRLVTLPAGDVEVRDFGPPEAPAVALLHGWTSSVDLNFSQCYGGLAERFRVVAFDLRGHGRGIRTTRPFRLADCADDVIAVADVLGVDQIIPVGYSLGGAVAQLLWRRHPDRVGGVVLCSTASRFNGVPIDTKSWLGLTGLATLARLTPESARRRVADRYAPQKHRDWEPWAVDIFRSHDWRMVLEAGAALGAFRSSGWVGTLAGPSSVIVTERDQVVPLARQQELADLLADAEVYSIDGGHDAAVGAAHLFVPALVSAIDSVIVRCR